MDGIGRKYAASVHEVTNYWGAYLPNVPVAVGDYVEFASDGSINHLGTSMDWAGFEQEFPVDTLPLDGGDTFDAHAKRERGVQASGGATGPGGIGANAGVTLDFTSEAGFVLDYQAAELRRFHDVEAVRKYLLAMAKNGDWKSQRALVTDVIAAASATVVMSREKSSNVVLNATATLPNGVGVLNLSDPKLGLTVTSSSGSTLISLCKASTPLYKVVRVRRSWLRRWHADLLAAPEAADVAAAFSDSPFEDDDESDV